MKAQHSQTLLVSTLVVALALFCACKSQGPSGPGKLTERRLAAGPYPPSSIFRGITWRWETHRTAALGSDLWPVTWGPDGNLYAAWGDGGGFGGSDSDGRVAMGFARIEGGPPDFHGVNVNGGKNPEHPASFPKKGKTSGILFLDGVLYALVNQQDGRWPDVTHVLAWSTNSGATWSKADWVFAKGIGNFQPARFLNFGPNYTQLPEHLNDFVYMCGPKQPVPGGKAKEIFLARVQKAELLKREAYQFFAGRGHDGQPVWRAEPSRMKPIFQDQNGTSTPTITWNPSVKRFLLTSFHMGPGQLGIFEGLEPWGPWRTISYYEDWGQMGKEGEGLSCDFPQKWMSADGLRLWSVFSVYGEGGKIGVQGHDRFNLVEAVLRQ